MSNPCHPLNGALTVQELADTLGVSFSGDGHVVLKNLQPLDTAVAGSLSFLDNSKYASLLGETSASAVILSPAMVDNLPEGVVAILSETPYATYARALNLFYPFKAQFDGVSDKAFVAESAKVGADVIVEPFAYIADGAVIGAGSYIASGAHVGRDVIIGANCRIGANAVLVCCEMGDDVVIHSNASIGQDGFGFAVDASVQPPEMLKVNQIGMVRIGNRVEIGAGSTVDRGSLSDTIIGDDTKIDNLVQIAHNVKMGAMCQIVAQSGVAGSTTLGNGVVVGGQTGFVGHINVGDGVIVASRSGVTKDIQEKGVYAGFPAIPMQKWRRLQAAIARLGAKK